MTFSDSEVEHLGAGLLLSNTPLSYLAWAQRSHVVQRMAEFDEGELLDVLAEGVRSRSEVGLALAYGALVALAMRRRRAAGTVGSLPLSEGDLSWAGSIWSRLESTGASGTAISLRSQSYPTLSVSADSPSVQALLGADGKPYVKVSQ